MDRKFTGRKIIYSSETEIDENNIPGIMNGAMLRHEQNRGEIEYLERYFTGDQPILKRVKQIRPDVNNKFVINNTYSFVCNVNEYFLGNPFNTLQKTHRAGMKSTMLNNMMDSIDKAYGDTLLGEWQSTCGTAYRLIFLGDNAFYGDKDTAPFEIPVLNPKYTSVIYSAKSVNKPLLGFMYLDTFYTNGNAVGRTYTAYALMATT